mgnify:CR=1 FL=1
MLIDITLKITPKMVTDAQGNEKKSLVGHLGTHFDVMDKEFPLEYTERKGICFDVSSVTTERYHGGRCRPFRSREGHVRHILQRISEIRRLRRREIFPAAPAAFTWAHRRTSR